MKLRFFLQIVHFKQELRRFHFTTMWYGGSWSLALGVQPNVVMKVGQGLCEHITDSLVPYYSVKKIMCPRMFTCATSAIGNMCTHSVLEVT